MVSDLVNPAYEWSSRRREVGVVASCSRVAKVADYINGKVLEVVFAAALLPRGFDVYSTKKKGKTKIIITRNGRYE